MPFNWECPFCSKAQVVTAANFDENKLFLNNTVESASGHSGLKVSHTRCSNPECNKITLKTSLHKIKSVNGRNYLSDDVELAWKLIPDSYAKQQPDCVPKVLQNDYYEACKIRDLSPKASATLARRCIQGMIRDFCNISKDTLFLEIKELKKLSEAGNLPRGVTEDSIDAIDHLRGIGNIGAHFEKDINLIIDVEPDEAQALIELIEMLFEEWYVAREKRQSRLNDIKKISVDKKEAKKSSF